MSEKDLPRVDTGFYTIPHGFDFDHPEEVVDVNQRGISPQNDSLLDKIAELEEYHS